MYFCLALCRHSKPALGALYFISNLLSPVSRMKLYSTLLLSVGIAATSLAQLPDPRATETKKTNVELSHIWSDYLFFPKYVAGFNFMKNGLYFTRMEMLNEQAEIVEYNISTGARTKSVYLAPKDVRLSNYSFSDDEQKILLETGVEKIYRYSSQANFFVLNLQNKELKPVSDNGKQRYASFNPTADKVAFVRNNNLFYKDLATGEEVQITKDGEHNKIINGATDWVYEEEFQLDKAFFWSPDGSKIAFLRFDETDVKEFRLTYFNNELYPTESTFKYPKAGELNSKVSVHCYDIATKKTEKIDIKGDIDQYVPRMKWTPDGELCIFRFNRHQNDLTLLLYNPKNGKISELLREQNKAFIAITNDFTFLNNKQFLWASDKDGYYHIYLYDMNGKMVRQLTKGNFDVTKVYGVDEKSGMVYFQRAAGNGVRREVCYSVLKTGEMKPLQTQAGTNDAQFSRDFKYYINEYSNALTPPTHIVYETAGNKTVRTIEDNKPLREILEKFNWGAHEFFTFKTTDGIELNGWRILPPNFAERQANREKLPVVMYVYGGPSRQTVVDEWDGSNYAWFQHLAQQGFVVVSVDGRGTDARGEEFRKSTYMQLGKYEVIDQIETAKYLGGLDYVDKNRIGIFGWSFGGYLSTSCLAKGAAFFKLAIAVAPVIHWKWYDTIYTERYMRTPAENKAGYDENSPINFAHLIKGKYLLIHGTGDDNVHAQNAFEMARVLVEKNIPFDQAYYTNKNHGIYGGMTRYHLYNKMTSYILQNL